MPNSVFRVTVKLFAVVAPGSKAGGRAAQPVITKEYIVQAEYQYSAKEAAIKKFNEEMYEVDASIEDTKAIIVPDTEDGKK